MTTLIEGVRSKESFLFVRDFVGFVRFGVKSFFPLTGKTFLSANYWENCILIIFLLFHLANTQRCFDIYLTSITSKKRWIDVCLTGHLRSTCWYWFRPRFVPSRITDLTSHARPGPFIKEIKISRRSNFRAAMVKCKVIFLSFYYL